MTMLLCEFFGGLCKKKTVSEIAVKGILVHRD